MIRNRRYKEEAWCAMKGDNQKRRTSTTPAYRPSSNAPKDHEDKRQRYLRLAVLLASLACVVLVAIVLVGASEPPQGEALPTPPIVTPKRTQTPAPLPTDMPTDTSATVQGLPSVAEGEPAQTPTAAPTVTPAPKVEGFFQEGSNGEAVRRLQERLTQLGYLRVAPDGVFGAQTTEAVKAFQSKQGLQADGVAGEATLTALFDENALDVLGMTLMEPKVYITPRDSQHYHASPACTQAEIGLREVPLSLARWEGHTLACVFCHENKQ